MAVIWPDKDNSAYWNGEYLTTKGAAKALGVTPQTILKYNKDKRYPDPIKRSNGGRQYYLYSKNLVIEIGEKTKEIRNGS